MKSSKLSAIGFIKFLNARKGWHGNQYRTACGQWLSSQNDESKQSPLGTPAAFCEPIVGHLLADLTQNSVASENQIKPLVLVGAQTGKPCPTRGKKLCTIDDPNDHHAPKAVWDEMALQRVDVPPRDLKMICGVPLQDGDWAVACTNPGHFLKVPPEKFGSLATHPAFSFFRSTSKINETDPDGNPYTITVWIRP